jgi:hypothetical protein
VTTLAPLPVQSMELILVAFDYNHERSVLVLMPERVNVDNANRAEPAENAVNCLLDDTHYCYPVACLFEADYTPEQWAGLKAACVPYE